MLKIIIVRNLVALFRTLNPNSENPKKNLFMNTWKFSIREMKKRKNPFILASRMLR